MLLLYSVSGFSIWENHECVKDILFVLHSACHCDENEIGGASVKWKGKYLHDAGKPVLHCILPLVCVIMHDIPPRRP